MDDTRSVEERDGASGRAIEGADDAAMGTAEPPESAPPAAQVDPSVELVPGADADERDRSEAKPWFTSLAADSDQAGVGNDPPDAQEPQFPTDAEDPR